MQNITTPTKMVAGIRRTMLQMCVCVCVCVWGGGGGVSVGACVVHLKQLQNIIASFLGSPVPTKGLVGSGNEAS